MLSELAPLTWVLLAFSAMLVGISKTAIPGINTAAVAVFAASLPPKSSTAALLLLLLLGDALALLSYRRHADWGALLRLIPAVAAGLACGALFLAFAEDGMVRRAIGIILLVLIALTLWRRYGRGRATGATPGAGRVAGLGYGTLGGFTTMVANAGGPVMSMYFIAAGFQVKAFLGTAAWFFAIVNITKVPILAGLGLFTHDVLLLDLLLVPGVLIGAVIGRWIAARIKQRAFEWIVIASTTLGAIYLLF